MHFVDVVILLTSSVYTLQSALKGFAAECEIAEMRIHTSKSETMALCQKRAYYSLTGLGGKLLPQEEKLKYFGAMIKWTRWTGTLLQRQLSAL